MNVALPRPEVEIVQMIVVCTVIGEGVDRDPVRRVWDYYTMAGEHVMRRDPWLEERR